MAKETQQTVKAMYGLFDTILGCTEKQYKDQKDACRNQLLTMKSKAELKGKYNGFTAEQLTEILKTY